MSCQKFVFSDLVGHGLRIVGQDLVSVIHAVLSVDVGEFAKVEEDRGVFQKSRLSLHLVDPLDTAVLVGKSGAHLCSGHVLDLVILREHAFDEDQDRGKTDAHVHIGITEQHDLDDHAHSREDQIGGQDDQLICAQFFSILVQHREYDDHADDRENQRHIKPVRAVIGVGGIDRVIKSRELRYDNEYACDSGQRKACDQTFLRACAAF